jgi:hypothetical protein
MRALVIVIFLGTSILFTATSRAQGFSSKPKTELCVGALHLEPSVKVREHRGSLADSLATEVEINRTMYSLASYISQTLGYKVEPKDIEENPYGFDARTGWDTYIILVKGRPFGFSDGYIPLPKKMVN